MEERHLTVDKKWCAKCRMCATVVNHVLKFDESGYPDEASYRGDEIEIIRIAVAKCPVHALRLG